MNDLIGKPFQWGARGPQAYDCWGLVLEVLRRLGHNCPQDWIYAPDDVRTIERIMAEGRRSWQALTAEQAYIGDVVLLGFHNKPHHAGVMVEFNLVLHTCKEFGCIAQSPRQLRRQGYQHQEWYRWVK